MAESLWDEIKKYLQDDHLLVQDNPVVHNEKPVQPRFASGVHENATPERNHVSMENAISDDDAEEIERLKHRYILGKRVGNDIYDHHGVLISPSGETITEDILRRSERSGKLVELILGMELGELGDGS